MTDKPNFLQTNNVYLNQKNIVYTTAVALSSIIIIFLNKNVYLDITYVRIPGIQLGTDTLINKCWKSFNICSPFVNVGLGFTIIQFKGTSTVIKF